MIKTVEFQGGMYLSNDLIVLRRRENSLEIALPFHEDTPNFVMSIGEAYALKNALDEVLNIRLLTCGQK
ncbi:hypothetical protein [Brevibacillus sp. IT-7CA2]|uniref:hypothetical protein n=1 Tax=Brevibacillus sp. IT-7CA2 TaxID=3026436 RepID=UPI0039E06889